MSTPTLSNFSVPLKVLGNAPFTLTPPTSNSSGAFSYVSSETSVATVLGNTVTIVGQGSTTITATQAAAGGFTSKTITATFIVLRQSPLNNNFVPSLNNPESSGILVSGDFYDLKQDVRFNVDITLPNPNMNINKYNVIIDSLESDNSTERKSYYFNSELIPIGRRVVGSFIKSNIKDVDINTKGFPFVDLKTYSIKHEAEITETNTVDGVTTEFLYVFNHTQV